MEILNLWNHFQNFVLKFLLLETIKPEQDVCFTRHHTLFFTLIIAFWVGIDAWCSHGLNL